MDSSWEQMGFGSYPVTIVPHYVHVLTDGTQIAAKLWLPWKSNNKSANKTCGDELLYEGNQKFPAILEYLPYRKSDWTAARDHTRHSWWCSHGYVCVRADQRGSGDSTGDYFDEYEKQEQTDCIEVIEWLSCAQWSNGRVGMYGKSWGGFNGLQVAYLKPKALKTVISLYSTDNRYTDDVHYFGNCVLGSGMLSWSSQMLLWNARPPTPKYCNSSEDFKKRWKNRLEKTTTCWAKTWLQHQHYDEYWKHGSICENYANVQCPTLIIGGLTDSYINAAFRMAASMNFQSRAIIGPWTHDWPDVSSAGPTIDFLTLCLNWWDYHLKGKENAAQDVSKWPSLQVYIRDAFPSTPPVTMFEGTWYGVPKWPELFKIFKNNDEEQGKCLKTFVFGIENELVEISIDPRSTQIVELPKPHLFQGLFCGDWISWGNSSMAGSQNIPNKFSSCWISKPLSDSLTLCGFTKIEVCVEASKIGSYVLAARLCHLWPTGESTLITYGICNLNYFDNGQNSELQKMVSNEKRNVSFNLNATTYIIPAGHKICLALATSLFPILYPLPKTDGILFLHLENCKCTLQILHEDFRKEHKGFSKPRPLLQFPKKMLDHGSKSKKVDFELNADLVKLVSNDGKEKIFYPSLDLEYSEQCQEIYETNFDGDFCDITISNSVEMKYKSESTIPEMDTKVETISKMSGDENNFYLESEVNVLLNGDKFFQQTWSDEIPRSFI